MDRHVPGVMADVSNPYQGVLLDRAAQDRRAAILRRRLLNDVQDIEAEQGQEANYIRGAWQEFKSKDGLRDRSRQSLLPEAEPLGALSLWA